MFSSLGVHFTPGHLHAEGRALGEARIPDYVVEFTDFLCSHCQEVRRASFGRGPWMLASESGLLHPTALRLPFSPFPPKGPPHHCGATRARLRGAWRLAPRVAPGRLFGRRLAQGSDGSSVCSGAAQVRSSPSERPGFFAACYHTLSSSGGRSWLHSGKLSSVA